MNAIPLINNAPKFRPDVNVNVNHIGGQSFNPVSTQTGNVMRQNPYGNETQLRQEVNTSIVALKREAFSLENLIAQAAQTLQDINKRLSELEGKQGDYVKKADATVASVGGDGKYISAISETDGKINATATDLGNMVPVNSVTSGNMHSVTSGAVYPIKQKVEKLYDTNILANVRMLPYIAYSSLPSQSTNDETYFKEWIDYLMATHYFDETRDVFIAQANPNFSVFVIGYTYGGTSVRTWSAFRYFTPNSGIGRFGYNNGNWYFSAPQ